MSASATRSNAAREVLPQRVGDDVLVECGLQVRVIAVLSVSRST